MENGEGKKQQNSEPGQTPKLEKALGREETSLKRLKLSASGRLVK
jgi:hypothetical protein